MNWKFWEKSEDQIKGGGDMKFKVKVVEIRSLEDGEIVTLRIQPGEGFDIGGATSELRLHITNPDAYGRFKTGSVMDMELS